MPSLGGYTSTPVVIVENFEQGFLDSPALGPLLLRPVRQGSPFKRIVHDICQPLFEELVSTSGSA